MKKQLIFSSIVLALILGVGAWFLYRPPVVPNAAELSPPPPAPVSTNPTTIANFRKEGRLSGQEGAWTFTYDEPGAPGRVLALEFNAASRCGEPFRACAEFPKTAGLRAYIEGIKNAEVLNVGTLRPLP